MNDLGVPPFMETSKWMMKQEDPYRSEKNCDTVVLAGFQSLRSLSMMDCDGTA